MTPITLTVLEPHLTCPETEDAEPFPESRMPRLFRPLTSDFSDRLLLIICPVGGLAWTVDIR